MQGVPLIVIQQSKSIPKREISQTAVNVAESKGKLIGVGQINLSPIANAGRTQGELPSVDARPLNGDRKENVGVVLVVVIEEIVRSR